MAVKATVENDKPEYISLALDGWSARRTGYLGAMATYINPQWERQAVCLGVIEFDEKHTSVNLAYWTTELLDEWGWREQTEIIVSDTAADFQGIFNKKRVPNLPPHFKPGKVMRMVLVSSLLTICWGICTTASHSVNFNNDFLKLQEENDPDGKVLHLCQDVSTRWNSTFIMLQRFLQLKEYIVQMSAKGEYSKLKLKPSD